MSFSSTPIAFLRVQNEPHIAKPMVLFSQSIYYTPNSLIIFIIVSLIIAPDETGAILPGNDNAQITFKPYDFAASKSIPPGLEARSIIRASFFTFAKISSSKISEGMVLKIISNSVYVVF